MNSTPNVAIGEVAAPAYKSLGYLALPRTGTITPVVGTTTTTRIISLFPKTTDANVVGKKFKNLRINTAGLYNLHYHNLEKNSASAISANPKDPDYQAGYAEYTGLVSDGQTFFQKFIRETAHAYYLQGQEVFCSPTHIEKYTEVTVGLTTKTYSFTAVSGQVYDILIAKKTADIDTITVSGCSAIGGVNSATKIYLDRQDCFKIRVTANATTVSLVFDQITNLYGGGVASDVKAYLVTGITAGDITVEF